MNLKESLLQRFESDKEIITSIRVIFFLFFYCSFRSDKRLFIRILVQTSLNNHTCCACQNPENNFFTDILEFLQDNFLEKKCNNISPCFFMKSFFFRFQCRQEGVVLPLQGILSLLNCKKGIITLWANLLLRTEKQKNPTIHYVDRYTAVFTFICVTCKN